MSEDGEALLKRDLMEACAKGRVTGHYLMVMIENEDGTQGDSRTYSHAASKLELWGSALHGLVLSIVKQDAESRK